MLSLVSAVMLLAAAPGAPGSATPSVITNPDWEALPSARDLANYYPAAAAHRGLYGQATVSCQVTEKGKLTDCSVLMEQPKDQHFGDAAVAMATKVFKMRPMLLDGKPVAGGVIRIPIRFAGPPDLRAGAVPVRNAALAGTTVSVNCRFKGSDLDNCLYWGSDNPSQAAADLAVKQAEEATLPPLPRKTGRILIPLRFVGEGPEPAASASGLR